jgi:hypothetical protein
VQSPAQLLQPLLLDVCVRIPYLSVVIVAAAAILKNKMKLQSSCSSNSQDLLTSNANDELIMSYDGNKL